MKNNSILISGVFFACILFFGCDGLTTYKSKKEYKWKEATSAGYTYKYVTNDPIKARLYTLDNGLKVILSVNKSQPRIAVNIAVRAGSNSDPKDHTGLAHYLEHLLFKGTDKIGSLNWEKEKPYLDRIEELYEQYDQTKDKEKRAQIYKKIDEVSNEASKYSISNEYDKLMGDIGSQGTNAHTSVEKTVYTENIPSNVVDKFLSIQAERFRNPVVRLFHTELEAVYEEKNRSLDNDFSKLSEKVNALLFPTHNYGQQTTLGAIEHLKNPSIKRIEDYYNKYYVPNNMAVIMVGDFDPDKLVKKIDEHFSFMKPKPVSPYNPAPEKPLVKSQAVEVFGPQSDYIMLNWRTPSVKTEDAEVMVLISKILQNGKAGLVDVDISQKQRLQGVITQFHQHKDYGVFGLIANAKEGQDLDTVKDILLEEIEKLKKGEFDDDLIKAIVANYRLVEQEGFKNSSLRLRSLMRSFIQSNGDSWDKSVSYLDRITDFTKKDILRVANKYLGDNYVVGYKRNGRDKDVVKVEKPPITPIETNAGKESEFVKKMKAISPEPIKPVWVDFDKDLTKSTFKNAELLYVKNNTTSLFELDFVFNSGIYNNILLDIAGGYLEYLSTDKYSSEDIKKLLYEFAGSYAISVYSQETHVFFYGPEENLEDIVKLFNHLIAHCKPNKKALEELKGRLLKDRKDIKKYKSVIQRGLSSYATYGAHNPFNTVMSEDEIKGITSEDLTDSLKDLFKLKPSISYYGTFSLEEIKSKLNDLYDMPSSFEPNPEIPTFGYKSQSEDVVLFTTYDMVQSEITWNINIEDYDPEQEPTIKVFNNYFGRGMGSLVFKTIRESKALAYTAYAHYDIPQRKYEKFKLQSYVGTQADKLVSSVGAMNDLLHKPLPRDENAFIVSRESIKSDIEALRIVDDGIINLFRSARKKGIDYDIREYIYTHIDSIDFEDIERFHKEKISGKHYTITVLGSEDKIDDDDLKKIGKLKKLSLRDVFGY